LRTIVHLSDLHFGRTDPGLPEALSREVKAAAPDIVVVSGDLTQRARPEEFRLAREFLATLPTPQIVVPGNHDVPLYNLPMRAFWPLARYKRHISRDVEPFFSDGEIAVAGLNTARSLTIKNGRVNWRQVSSLCAGLQTQPDGVVRIVVTHHPFETSDAGAENIVGRAAMAMAAFSTCRIDLILSGHLHVNRVFSSAARYRIGDYSALLLQAGTAISSRRREEPNSFNILRVNGRRIGCECWTWDGGKAAFGLFSLQRFIAAGRGWISDVGEALPQIAQRPSGEVAVETTAATGTEGAAARPLPPQG
jgi:3',5'-cyclic AMP phosphodiesterase CpdA